MWILAYFSNNVRRIYPFPITISCFLPFSLITTFFILYISLSCYWLVYIMSLQITLQITLLTLVVCLLVRPYHKCMHMLCLIIFLSDWQLCCLKPFHPASRKSLGDHEFIIRITSILLHSPHFSWKTSYFAILQEIARKPSGYGTLLSLSVSKTILSSWLALKSHMTNLDD